MATAYSTLLGLALPVQGELSGTWGDTVNSYITNYLDAAIAGTQTVSTDANTTLTKTTGTALGSTSSQYAIINCTGARTAQRTITAPATSKLYAIINATTGGFGVQLVGAGPTAGVLIPNGMRAFVVWNGSDFSIVSMVTVAGLTPVTHGGTGLATLTGLAYGNGTAAFSAATAAQVVGVISTTAVTNATNATNITAGTTGDVLYQSAAGVTAKLADVATGNALISGGVGIAPSYGKIGLTTHVSGTLPATSGGTGQSTYAVGDILVGGATNTLAKVADVATGNALISGGVGVAPSYGKIGLTTHVSGTLPVLNGGTGATTTAAAPFALKGANTDITSVTALASINGGQIAGFRNKIINGDMRIDQRYAGAAVTPAASVYLVDRFQCIVGAASKLTFQQVADAPPGFKFSTRVTVASQYAPAAAEQFVFVQTVEGNNIADLQFGTATAKVITASLWVKGTVAGTYCCWLLNAAGNRAYVGTITVTASWARQSITLTGETGGTWATDNTTGMYFGIDLGSGSNFITTAGAWQGTNVRRTSGSVVFVNQTAGATLHVTGFQLEIGSIATEFEHRPYGTELALCQRYFWRLIAANPAEPAFNCNVYTATNAYGVMQFPVTMRVAPSCSINRGGAFTIYANATAVTSTGLLGAGATPSTLEIALTMTAGLTTGYGAWARFAAANDYLQVSAEL